ncbi:MAG: hypothetical protein COT17_01655 [Elusimicrobia bacterium CG08_land_8_20_14_0_20_51_18]|nr:MAG: hypothetical protein COT17_01655 [Elusimicrobia bacterium CG08_land_8_20_14_0_20_51_18]
MRRDIVILSHEEVTPLCEKMNGYLAEPLLSLEGFRPEIFVSNPPLALTLLCSYLNEKGMNAFPVNNPFQIPAGLERLKEELSAAPLAVGICTDHIFRRETLEKIVGAVRAFSPSSLIIAGGPGVGFNPDLRLEGVVNVLGPGEKTLFRLLSRLKAGENFENLNNISYFKTGVLLENPQTANMPLDETVFPDYGLYSPEKIRSAFVQGSRGCRFKCGFCSYGLNGLELRSPGRVSAEIRRNADEFGICFFRFVDNNLPADKKWLLEVLRGIKDMRGLVWTCFARVDSAMDGELLDAMAAGGCGGIFLGIESGSQKMLSAMNKMISPEMALKAVAAIKARGIAAHGNFLVGYPGETEDTLAETGSFIKKSGLDTVYFSPLRIRPGDIPACADAEGGLVPEGSKWKHATMDSAGAEKEAEILVKEMLSDPACPPVSNEMLCSCLNPEALRDFRAGYVEFSREIRAWHQGKLSGDAKVMLQSAEKMKKMMV